MKLGNYLSALILAPADISAVEPLNPSSQAIGTGRFLYISSSTTTYSQGVSLSQLHRRVLISPTLGRNTPSPRASPRLALPKPLLCMMGFLGLSYRRPAAQAGGAHLSQESLESFGDESWRSVQSFASAGVPAALSFDRIMEGGTCPVRTLNPAHQQVLNHIR